MTYLDSVPFDDKETLLLFSVGESSDLPYFSHEKEVPLYYQRIDDFQFRDIININALYRGNTEKLEEYIRRREHPEKKYDESIILKDTCGLIVYRQQIEKLIKMNSYFSDGQADRFRRAFGTKSKDEIKFYTEKFYKSAIKFMKETEIEAFLKKLYDASEYMFNYDYALLKSKEIYLNAYFKVHHPEIYNDNRAELSKRIAIFAKYNIDVKNDFITFRKQMVDRFGDFYGKQSELILERAIHFIKEGSLESAFEQGKFAYSLSQYQGESYAVIYILFVNAQLCIDTKRFSLAKYYCDTITDKLDPKDKDYDEDKMQLHSMMEIIKSEGWKEDREN